MNYTSFQAPSQAPTFRTINSTTSSMGSKSISIFLSRYCGKHTPHTLVGRECQSGSHQASERGLFPWVPSDKATAGYEPSNQTSYLERSLTAQIHTGMPMMMMMARKTSTRAIELFAEGIKTTRFVRTVRPSDVRNLYLRHHHIFVSRAVLRVE